MRIRDVLVYVDNDAQSAARCAFAVSLAAHHGAHLGGLYARRPLYDARYIGTYIPADVVAVLEREADALQEQAAAVFAAAHRGAGLDVDWCVVDGGPGAELTAQGRNSDLVILAQRNRDDSGEHRNYVPEEVLLGAGRPVLLLPRSGGAVFPPRHALVAWNAGREAARAVRDALPMLADCQRVTVSTVAVSTEERAETGDAAASVIRYLARHGIDAETHRVERDDIDAGAALLALAGEHRADLIVAGAYGHSRLREFVLGGSTAYLMRHGNLPLLLSH